LATLTTQRQTHSISPHFSYVTAKIIVAALLAAALRYTQVNKEKPCF
jgi:hypothetical protein